MVRAYAKTARQDSFKEMLVRQIVTFALREPSRHKLALQNVNNVKQELLANPHLLFLAKIVQQEPSV